MASVLAAAMLGACSAGASAPRRLSGEGALPAVVGQYGTKPELDYAHARMPSRLQSQLLHKGTGRTVHNGDLLVVDYVGQVWNGLGFDNSYDRGSPAALVIGRGKAITGWDDVLVGVPVGSRILMSVPPDKAYGVAGKPSAGIKANDTLVFVVDVEAAYNRFARGDAHAIVQNVATPGVRITGAVGAVPVLTIVKGARAPRRSSVAVLARGAGDPVTTGLVIVQYVAEHFTGGGRRSTFARGVPAGITITGASTSQPFALLRGVPTGSRVLLTLPGAKGRPATAAVVDIIAQPTSAAVHG